MQRRWALVACVCLLALAGCSSANQARVVVGSGTTLVDSQFMAEIAAAYNEVEPRVSLSVVGLSSAEAIALAGAGNADVIITHDRGALDDFLVQSQAALRFDAFVSLFFIVAAPEIGLAASSLSEALKTVAAEPYRFVSRDDGSGTNASELAAWAAAGIDPSDEPWYTRTGTGMGATLQVTDQVQGITLARRTRGVSCIGGSLVADPDRQHRDTESV